MTLGRFVLDRLIRPRQSCGTSCTAARSAGFTRAGRRSAGRTVRTPAVRPSRRPTAAPAASTPRPRTRRLARRGGACAQTSVVVQHRPVDSSLAFGLDAVAVLLKGLAPWHLGPWHLVKHLGPCQHLATSRPTPRIQVRVC
jgi:hypothetical protein